MDNVTHSLAGLLIAEGATRLRARVTQAEPSREFGTVAAISSLIAANLPDADLVYSGLGGSHLEYMLQHRGYTHTVLVALIGAVLMFGVSIQAWRWRAREGPTRDDRHWLLGLLVLSTLSHLLLDWTNSYGVHPFWPVDNHWYYGDAVFIVEPWLWVVSVPVLVRATRSGIVRVVLSLVLLASLVLAWRVELVSAGAAATLTVGAALSVVLAVVLNRGARAAAAVACWVAVTLIFAAGSTMARRTILGAVRGEQPAPHILDIVVSPLPANPVCASAIAVEEFAGSFRVATARVSALPTLVDATRCGSRQGSSPMLTPATRPSTSSLHWDGEWAAPSADLAILARESCYVLSALRFIRVPIWRLVSDSTVLLGDVRYGGGSGSGFTDVEVRKRSATCPTAVPPWIPPRADLLGP